MTRNNGHIWQLVTYDHSLPSMCKGIFKEAALTEKNEVTRMKKEFPGLMA